MILRQYNLCHSMFHWGKTLICSIFDRHRYQKRISLLFIHIKIVFPNWKEKLNINSDVKVLQLFLHVQDVHVGLNHYHYLTNLNDNKSIFYPKSLFIELGQKIFDIIVLQNYFEPYHSMFHWCIFWLLHHYLLVSIFQYYLPHSLRWTQEMLTEWNKWLRPQLHQGKQKQWPKNCNDKDIYIIDEILYQITR